MSAQKSEDPATELEIRKKARQYQKEYQKEYRSRPENRAKNRRYSKEYQHRPDVIKKRRERNHIKYMEKQRLSQRYQTESFPAESFSEFCRRMKNEHVE